MSPASEVVRILATLLAIALVACLGVIFVAIIRGVWRRTPPENTDE